MCPVYCIKKTKADSEFMHAWLFISWVYLHEFILEKRNNIKWYIYMSNVCKRLFIFWAGRHVIIDIVDLTNVYSTPDTETFFKTALLLLTRFYLGHSHGQSRCVIHLQIRRCNTEN